MDIDTTKLRDLLDKRDAIDQEIAAMVQGTKERKIQACGTCHEIGHSARTCPQKTA